MLRKQTAVVCVYIQHKFLTQERGNYFCKIKQEIYIECKPWEQTT
jgi:hypothetical protein